MSRYKDGNKGGTTHAETHAEPDPETNAGPLKPRKGHTKLDLDFEKLDFSFDLIIFILNNHIVRPPQHFLIYIEINTFHKNISSLMNDEENMVQLTFS